MIVCFVCENLFVFWHNEQTETNKPPGSIQKFEEKPYFEKKIIWMELIQWKKKLKMVVIENKDPHPKKNKNLTTTNYKIPFFSVFII